MDEYALRFYALLEQSIKLDAKELKDLSIAMIAANSSAEGRESILSDYDRIAYDIIEDLKNNTPSNNATNKLKEIING